MQISGVIKIYSALIIFYWEKLMDNDDIVKRFDSIPKGIRWIDSVVDLFSNISTGPFFAFQRLNYVTAKQILNGFAFVVYY